MTPLYRLKTASYRVAEVLTALSEGLDVSAAVRVSGHRHATITTWLTRAGAHSATLHDRAFRDLYLPHLQLDEIRTRLRSRARGLWLWLAVDPITKIVPVLHLGARTQDAAHAVIHDLRQRLAPGCIPVFTSDGLNLYFYALTAHFGQWVVGVRRRARKWQVTAALIYGQVKKAYRRRRLVRVTPVMRCGTRAARSAALTGLGLSGRLTTAFVERLNLTVRQSVAALVRRTWSTAQQAPHLLMHLEWWRAYYHFVCTHETLRVELREPLERGGKRLPQRYASAHQRWPLGWSVGAGRFGICWHCRSCQRRSALAKVKEVRAAGSYGSSAGAGASCSDQIGQSCVPHPCKNGYRFLQTSTAELSTIPNRSTPRGVQGIEGL